ncbi:MAG: bifunctional pyr operon transcriptional regulator/uracil phosphoribosyltransferase PyrR [bacterium]
MSLMSERDFGLALRRIASEIVERCGEDAGLALIGIRTRGEPLARRLAAHIRELEGMDPPVGILDIGIHRDDLGHPGDHPIPGTTEVGFDVAGRQIVLVDDVFFTGRTVRAALDALSELGRPRRVWLAALIDRGHRELPFRPDFVGKNLPTARGERVNVRVQEVDGEEGVWLERPD